MEDTQLRETAKKLGIKVPGNMGVKARAKVEDEIQVALFKKDLELKERARHQRQAEVNAMLGTQLDGKPAPETIAIANSKKVYAIYFNRTEDKGADIAFNKGCTHDFHLYDRCIHILPQCLIDEAEDLENPVGKTPIHGTRPDPRPGIVGEVSQIIGHESRYDFKVLGDAPQDAPFGVITDEAIYKKFHTPFPVRKETT
jgi:hypothetical protein